MGIDESTLFSIGGFIVFLVSSYLFCCLFFWLINGAHSQSQLAVTLIWEAHLLPVCFLEYSETHGPSSLGWVFMEVKYTRMSTHIQAYKCNHTQPSVNIFPPKEMAHLSWDIPNKLISLLKKLSVQGLAWDLVWSSWRGTLKMPQLPWRRGCVGRGRQDSCPLVCVTGMTALHLPLLPWITLCAEILKVVMAPERWLWVIKETNKRNCPLNWGYGITSSLVIKLEIHGVHVHFFLCKLIYKYWSGVPGCFWGNMSSTTVYIQGTYLLFWIQWRNLLFCTQSPAKGVRAHVFLRLLNQTSKISYLWLKIAQNSASPQKGTDFLIQIHSSHPPKENPRKQNHRNPIVIPTIPLWGRLSVTVHQPLEGTCLKPWYRQKQESQRQLPVTYRPIQTVCLVILAP